MPAKTRKAELRPAAKKASKKRPASLSERVDKMADALVLLGELTTTLGKVILARCPEPTPPATVEPVVEPDAINNYTPEEKELITWMNNTPTPSLEYGLDCYDDNGTIQKMVLTEAEYNGCKEHVVMARGLDCASDLRVNEASNGR